MFSEQLSSFPVLYRLAVHVNRLRCCWFPVPLSKVLICHGSQIHCKPNIQDIGESGEYWQKMISQKLLRIYHLFCFLSRYFWALNKLLCLGNSTVLQPSEKIPRCYGNIILSQQILLEGEDIGKIKCKSFYFFDGVTDKRGQSRENSSPPKQTLLVSSSFKQHKAAAW